MVTNQSIAFEIELYVFISKQTYTNWNESVLGELPLSLPQRLIIAHLLWQWLYNILRLSLDRLFIVQFHCHRGGGDWSARLVRLVLSMWKEISLMSNLITWPPLTSRELLNVCLSIVFSILNKRTSRFKLRINNSRGSFAKIIRMTQNIKWPQHLPFAPLDSFEPFWPARHSAACWSSPVNHISLAKHMQSAKIHKRRVIKWSIERDTLLEDMKRVLWWEYSLNCITN